MSCIKPEVLSTVLGRIAELSAETGLQFVFLNELFPNGKALSVPRDSTALLRWDSISTEFLAVWTGDDSLEKLETARKGTSELNRLLLSAEDKLPADVNTGYGNYRERSASCACISPVSNPDFSH